MSLLILAVITVSGPIGVLSVAYIFGKILQRDGELAEKRDEEEWREKNR